MVSLFWKLLAALAWCCHLLSGENVLLDLTTANGYQWEASLPNGSKSLHFAFISGIYFLAYSVVQHAP